MNALEIFHGSDASATKAFYSDLRDCGAIGEVALCLFRAQKASRRALRYGTGYHPKGSVARMAYQEKIVSIGTLCRVLMENWRDLRISWGWRRDPREKSAPWILYIDLPTGQVYFQSIKRMTGPDYFSNWDHQSLSDERIIEFCEGVLRTRQEKILRLF